MQRESDLYPPLKAHFVARGLSVKGEIGAADLVAMGGEVPVIVEMKLKFSLTLYHQGIERLKITPQVYLAVLRPEGAAAKRMIKDNTAMCRRLALGLMTVRIEDPWWLCYRLRTKPQSAYQPPDTRPAGHAPPTPHARRRSSPGASNPRHSAIEVGRSG